MWRKVLKMCVCVGVDLNPTSDSNEHKIEIKLMQWDASTAFVHFATFASRRERAFEP